MTYRALTTFINKNTNPHNNKIFDLMSYDIKSKIIFVIGNGACNTAEYLSSIMSACNASYLHYIDTPDTDLNKRFLQNGNQFSLDVLCEKAESILNKCKRNLSNDDLMLCLALSFDNVEYTIVEIKCEYYNEIKDVIAPFALIITENDEQNLIENVPYGTKEIIAISNDANYDYVSSKYTRNGARITFASPNKITISNGDLLGTSFYHYDYLYRISALDLNNVPLAHLSIEAASVIFNTPRPYIYQGLAKATAPKDLSLYSLSPAILLRNGENNFKLHHKLKFKVITMNDEFEIPSESTVFCGDANYIQSIKNKLEKHPK